LIGRTSEPKTAKGGFGVLEWPLLRLVWVAALSTTHKASSKDPE